MCEVVDPAVSGLREVDPAVSGLCEVDPAVSGLCEVDPAVSGLYEVGPAETGLARSASCRSDGGLVLEPGRKRVVVRCCLVTAVKPVGLKSTGTARERNGSEPPDRRCLFGRYGGSLLLLLVSLILLPVTAIVTLKVALRSGAIDPPGSAIQIDLSRRGQKGCFAQVTIKAAVLGAAAVPRPVW